MLDNNVNKNIKNPQFLSLSQQQALQAQQQQLAMQAVNPELLNTNLQDTYVGNRVSETTEDPKGMLITGAIAIPAWFAIAKGMDYYAAKSRGDYNTTVHAKIGNFADGVVDKFNTSSFGKSGFVSSIKNGWNTAKNFVSTKIIDKSRVLRAFRGTPTSPELDMVKGQANGMVGMLGFDYPQVAENFIKETKYVEDLVCYGAKADDITKFKSIIGQASTPEARSLAMQAAEFECLSKYTRGTKLTGSALDNAVEAFKRLAPEERLAKLKDMKAFEFGFKDFKEFSLIKENIQENLPRIMEASHNANKNMYSNAYPAKKSLFGWLKRILLNRKVYASEFANKMAASLGSQAKDPKWQAALKSTGLDKAIPKTSLARGLTKFNNLVLEGATNRVAGGKLVAIMQAAYLADVIYKSIKAEGGIGEKGRTFAERFTEMIAFFACMPLAIQLMHRIGGLKYAGMTPEQVAKYRENLKIHNEKAMKGEFATKADWKASKKALKTELKAGVKNPFVKFFKWIGRTVSVGLEQIRPWDKKDIADIAKDGTKTYRKGIMSKIKDFFRHPKFGFKQMAGYPMRIVVGMAMILPFLSKIAVKGSHLIFGKPKNSVLDEGKEKEPVKPDPNQTQVPSQLQNTIPNQQTVQQTTTTQNVPLGQSPTNLLNKYRNGQTTTTTTTTTSTATNDKSKNNEPVRTYIPSPIGVKLMQGEDLSPAEAALRRADFAEQEALQTLKMN